MEDADGGVVRPAAGSGEVKPARKQLAIQFKAQHALVVAFFLLLLYTQLRIDFRGTMLTHMTASFTPLPSTCSAAASSYPDSYFKIDPNAPFHPSLYTTDTLQDHMKQDAGILRALTRQ